MRYFIRENGGISQVNELTNPTTSKEYAEKYAEITEAEYKARKPKEIKPNPNDMKIADLKQKLAETDYKLFKYLEGDLSREEYLPIMAQRKEWRTEINRLEGETEPSIAEPIK